MPILAHAATGVNALSPCLEPFGPVPDLATALQSPALHLMRPTPDLPDRIVQAVAPAYGCEDGRTALVVVGSTKEAEQFAEDLNQTPHSTAHMAMAYPKRDESNCQSLPDVQAAESAGLSPGMAVCPACPHRDGCPFLRQRDAAFLAQVTVVPAAVVLADPLGRCEGKDALLVVAGEALDSLRFLRPFVPGWTRAGGGAGNALRGSVPSLVAGLELIRGAAEEIEDGARNGYTRNRETGEFYTASANSAAVPFWQHLWGTCNRLIERLTRAPYEAIPGVSPQYQQQAFAVVGLSVPSCPAEPPQAWAATLWSVLRQRKNRPDGRLLRLVLTSVLGRVDLIEGTVSDHQTGEASLYARERTALPQLQPVVFIDAGLTADLLTLTSGRAVQIIGGTEMNVILPAAQVAVHLTTHKRAAGCAGLVRAAIARSPGKKVGVICHRSTWPKVKKELKRSGTHPDKVAFWKGDGLRDLRECDLVVALGTPPVGPEAVRSHLIQTGETEAAAIDPKTIWGPLPWQAVTTTGETVAVPMAAGYRSEKWQAARRHLIDAEFRRTAALLNGVPVVVLSDEQLGLPVVGTKAVALSWRDGLILGAIRTRLLGGDVAIGEAVTGDCTGDSTQKGLLEKSLLRSDNVAQPESLSPLTGLSAPAIRKRLTVLRRAGFVTYRKGRGWSLPAAEGRAIPSDGQVYLVSGPGQATLAASTFISTSPANCPGDSFLDQKAETERLLVDALALLVDEGGGLWSGTADRLDAALALLAERQKAYAGLKGWLAGAERIGKALTRVGALLQAAGLTVTRARSKKARRIELRRAEG